MKIRVTALLLLTSLTTAGCATIIDGSKQDMNIVTSDKSAAECVVKNAQHQQFNVTTPSVVKMDKGNAPVTVECQTSNGQKGTTVVNETLNPWFFGNILIGGIPGMVIDGVTGAYQEYDTSTVSVPLTSATNSSSVTPAAAAPHTKK